MSTNPVPDNIRSLERPHPALWRYYILMSLCTGPGLLASLPYLFFRYHTLRYRFDEEGIHMKVGLLFRREVNLTYARIQDIHLRSGIIQRWLGLANVQIQTASGSSGPELVIEGFKEFEAIRDFLYTRMRGYQTVGTSAGVHAAAVGLRPVTGDVPATADAGSSASVVPNDREAISLLLAIRDELRRTRELLENSNRTSNTPPSIPPPTEPIPGSRGASV